MQARLAELNSMIGNNSRNGFVDKELPRLSSRSVQPPISSMVTSLSLFSPLFKLVHYFTGLICLVALTDFSFAKAVFCFEKFKSTL